MNTDEHGLEPIDYALYLQLRGAEADQQAYSETCGPEVIETLGKVDFVELLHHF